jgi:hypothetical protein
MRAVICLPHARRCQVRVNLCARERLMTEQFLNCSKIRTVVEQVRRE